MTTSKASSHQKLRLSAMIPRRAAHEARNAVVIARATNVIIPGLREPISGDGPRQERTPSPHVQDGSQRGRRPTEPGDRRERVAQQGANIGSSSTVGTASASMIQNSRRNRAAWWAIWFMPEPGSMLPIRAT